jgi:beta-galactosidase
MANGGSAWGVDWYPEQWDEERWRADVERMRAQGFRSVRMMEFAWSVLEPRPGEFDFGLFDRAIGLAAENGLSVVLGTPTAAFPAWLLDLDPGVLAVHPSGLERAFGTRRMGCLNVPAYRAAADRIVSAVAERYGRRAEVSGWQIDNEIGHEGSDRCVCGHCRAAWARWLERRYGTVEALNAAWGTVFWSGTLSRFDQAPVPRAQPATGFNPALLLDYDRFSSDVAVDWVRGQAAVLRRYGRPGQWITANLYPSPFGACIDMEELAAELDVVGWDNYPVWGDQSEPLPYFFTAFELAYVRGLKDFPAFKVMEQFTGFQGHTSLGYLPPPAQTALWTNQALAHGADAVFYFRWRTAAFAQEQLCYGLRDTDDLPTEREADLVGNLTGAGADIAALAGQAVVCPACLVYDRDCSRLVREQPLSAGLDVRANGFLKIGYDMELARAYAPFALFNVGADVKSARSVDLARYRVVSLPLYELADPAFVGRLADWVAGGGTLILGWRAGARTTGNRNIDAALPGVFAELAGLRVRSFEALGKGSVGLRLAAGTFGPLAAVLPHRGEIWADILEPTTAKTVARYHDKRKHYSGAPAICRNAYGAGAVWYFGASPAPTTLFFTMERVLKLAGVAPRFLGQGVELVRRRAPDGKIATVALNHTAKPRRIRVAGGPSCRVAAYGSAVLRP